MFFGGPLLANGINAADPKEQQRALRGQGGSCRWLIYGLS